MELILSRFVFYAALVAGLLSGFVVVFREARRRRPPWGLIGVAGLTVVCGLGIGLLGGAHLVGVTMGALARGEAFEYDFRFYSLVLLGTLISLPGFVCFFSACGLVRTERAAWKRALALTLFLLALNAPLIPIQGFAELLSGLALANLLGLLAARRYFRPTT